MRSERYLDSTVVCLWRRTDYVERGPIVCPRNQSAISCRCRPKTSRALLAVSESSLRASLRIGEAVSSWFSQCNMKSDFRARKTSSGCHYRQSICPVYETRPNNCQEKRRGCYKLWSRPQVCTNTLRYASGYRWMRVDQRKKQAFD